MSKFLVVLCVLATPLFAVAQAEIPAISPEAQAQYTRLIEADAADPLRYTERWRPQLGFSAVRGYLNDPNGLVYFNGQWHLMYQHWKLPFIDGCNWGHAVSNDLVHWKHLPPALTKDANGDIWSGSAVVDDRNESGFFPDRKAGIVAFFTYRAKDGYQSVGVAYSADGTHWRKYAGNPVLGPLKGGDGQDDQPGFRDPKVFWYAPTQRWIMVVGADKFRIYSSENLREWRLESVENFATECPDLFELPVCDAKGKRTEKTKWVLSLSSVNYRLGTFDGTQFRAESGDIPFSHKSNLYAAQTFSDAPNARRILVHWHNRYDQEKLGTSWGCALSIPVELSLHEDAEGALYLAQTPVAEFARLRQAPRCWEALTVRGARGTLEGVRAVPAEIEVVFEPQNATRAGVVVRAGENGERTRIGYNAEKGELFIDRSQAGLGGFADFPAFLTAPMRADADGKIRLRIFVDESLVDVFSEDGRQRLAAWIFPAPASDGIDLFADGGVAVFDSVKVYPLDSPWRAKTSATSGVQKALLGRTFYKLRVGEPLVLSVAVFPRDARRERAKWTTSDTTVGLLTPRGDAAAMFTPLKSGATTVSVDVGGQTDACRIFVYEPSLVSNVRNWAADDESAWNEIANGVRGEASAPGKRTHYNATDAPIGRGVIETDITLESGARAGLFFRDNGRHKVCYPLYLDADTGTLELFRQLDWRKIERVASAKIPVVIGKPLRLSVTLADGKIYVAADGTRVLETADSGIDPNFRRFSLFVHTGAAVFQNVRAQATPEGETRIE